LLAVCLLWAIKMHSLPTWFSLYSAFSALVSIVALVLMLRALKANINLGLYQRINYGVLAAWVVVLSVMLLKEYVCSV